MVLKTSMWAKRHYVKFKRWQPKAGRWADWGLRRRSARRREAMRKERKERRAAEALREPSEENRSVSEILGATGGKVADAENTGSGD
jgi:hypothetical protein